MAKLTKKKRSGLRQSQFALPEERKYPVHDRVHAILAKQYATKNFRRGILSAAQLKAIHAKANRVLISGRGVRSA